MKGDLTKEQKEILLHAANNYCPLHNSFSQGIEVEARLGEAPP